MKTTVMKKNWYCWVIAFACLLLSAASVGMLSYFNALFLTPVSQSLQVKRSALTLSSTFSTITTMTLLPFMGKIFKRFPIRLLILIGAILGSCAHLCYSFANSVYGFYIGGILAGLAACLFGSVPITLLLSNWFVEKRGLVTGIAFAGSGLVSSALSPTVSALIADSGWKSTYRLIAAAILITTLLSILLIRPDPVSMGLSPYGSNKTSPRNSSASGFMQQETIRPPAYWILALAFFLLGLIIMGTQSQLVSYWQSVGISADYAVRMYSAVLLAAVAGKILIGMLYDHLSIFAASLICCSVCFCAFISLLFCTQEDCVVISAVSFGLSSAMQVILPAYLTQKFFGTFDYVSNVGLITTILYLGVSVGTPSGALVYDLTGDYRLAWILFAILSIAVLVCILIANRLSQSFMTQANFQGKGHHIQSPRD